MNFRQPVDPALLNHRGDLRDRAFETTADLTPLDVEIAVLTRAIRCPLVVVK